MADLAAALAEIGGHIHTEPGYDQVVRVPIGTGDHRIDIVPVLDRLDVPDGMQAGDVWDGYQRAEAFAAGARVAAIVTRHPHRERGAGMSDVPAITFPVLPDWVG